MSSVRSEVVVEAPADRAFRVFTEKMETWWPATHHIGKSEFKSIVLDPTQLASVKAALALGLRAESTRTMLEQSYTKLQLQETLDSSRALLTRLQGVNVRTVQRRWQAALLHLHRARNGEPPGS